MHTSAHINGNTSSQTSVSPTVYCSADRVKTRWSKAKTEVPRDVRNSKVQKQDKFRRYWSQH